MKVGSEVSISVCGLQAKSIQYGKTKISAGSRKEVGGEQPREERR